MTKDEIIEMIAAGKIRSHQYVVIRSGSYEIVNAPYFSLPREPESSGDVVDYEPDVK